MVPKFRPILIMQYRIGLPYIQQNLIPFCLSLCYAYILVLSPFRINMFQVSYMQYSQLYPNKNSWFQQMNFTKVIHSVLGAHGSHGRETRHQRVPQPPSPPWDRQNYGEFLNPWLVV